jgi:MFS transporter, SP family, general alpha glucoside:H+ symporter
VLNAPAPWGYRIPFALQWFWPIPLIIGIYLAPESPWWLIRQNHLDKAKAALVRLATLQADVGFGIEKIVAFMVLTTEHGREVHSSTGSVACFQSTNLRRTIIVIGCYFAQLLDENSMRADSAYFLRYKGYRCEREVLAEQMNHWK